MSGSPGGTLLNVTEAPLSGGTQLQVTANAGATRIDISQSADGLVVGDGTGWSQTFAPDGRAVQADPGPGRVG